MSKIIKVPNIGVDQVEVIEICVSVGDKVSTDDSIFIGETDKASMEIPISADGTIEEIYIKVGDKVTPNSDMVKISSAESEPVEEIENSIPNEAQEVAPQPEPEIEAETKPDDTMKALELKKPKVVETENTPLIENMEEITPEEEEYHESPKEIKKSTDHSIDKWLPPVIPLDPEGEDTEETYIYAGPSVRKLARKLGVDLTKVRSPSGPKGRLTKNDIYDYVQANLSDSEKPTLSASGLPDLVIESSENIEEVPLSKIQQISAQNLQRNSMNIPHVTQFDKCDITEMNVFRKSISADVWEQNQVKLTVLPFIIKAVTYALKDNPKLNSSITNDVSKLYLKKYYNIGIAVNTPSGLLVPVVKDADKLSIKEIAIEVSRLTEKAKSGKLLPNEMSDATFTISSLGGISGTGFTPIVNWPEVGILGISPAKIEAIYDGSEFLPRLMLPLSLSYDHRAVDGVDAALFTQSVSIHLQDIRRMTL